MKTDKLLQTYPHPSLRLQHLRCLGLMWPVDRWLLRHHPQVRRPLSGNGSYFPTGTSYEDRWPRLSLYKLVYETQMHTFFTSATNRNRGLRIIDTDTYMQWGIVLCIQWNAGDRQHGRHYKGIGTRGWGGGNIHCRTGNIFGRTWSRDGEAQIATLPIDLETGLPNSKLILRS